MRLGKKRTAIAAEDAVTTPATTALAGTKPNRAERKQARKAAKAAKKEPRSLFDTMTDPKTAKRVIAVAGLVGPVVAPYGMKAATGLRGYLDERRADRLGVPVEEVAGYRGATGPAAARIDGLRNSIDDLRRRRSTDLQVSRFADVARDRLADLGTATAAAASMPPSQRRVTLHAINKELTQIEADLMTFLVGAPH